MFKVFKMMKWLVGIGVGLFVLALIVVWLMLNGLVRKAVEAGANSSLQVPTTLGSATLSPLGGSVGLSDLKVGSPPGFTSPQIFTLGDIDVSSSVGNLFGTPTRIGSIRLNAPQLVIEQAGGKFNFMALKEKLAGGGTGDSLPADPNAKPLKLVIDQLDVADAGVTIIPGIPGVDRTYQLKLPAISLKNIGNADGTQTGAEIGRVVNELIAVMAAKAAESDQLPPEVRQLMSLDVNKIGEQLQGRAKEEIDKAKQKLGGELNRLLEGGKKKKE